MIGKQVHKSFGFLRTTALGGIFFLLPLIVVGALLGQLIQVVWVAASSVTGLGIIPANTPWGYALLFASGVVILVLLCFLSGIIARWALGKKFRELVEKYLLMLFPRYAIFKEQLTDNIGGNEFRNSMKPVLIHYLDYKRLAMEIERNDDGDCVVFLPGSPDPWTGTVIIVSTDRVTRINETFGETMATFEQLGRRTLATMNKIAQ